MSKPTISAIRLAAARIEPYIHRTPVLTCHTIEQQVGEETQLFFKCENLQRAGAFKLRGACHAVFSLPEEIAEAGVATHSSGNHAAALALAASLRGIPAFVVMPANTSEVKKRAVSGYGAEITFCEPTLGAREEGLKEVLAKTGATEVHPYNDPHVIAGQGTAALELLEDIPDLDVLMAPVGGGGLISGTALCTEACAPEARVIAVEPAAADDAYRSWKQGRLVPSKNPQTICDGLRTSLGSLTFSIIQRHVHEIVTVEEQEIIDAMRIVWERMKIIIEPSAAVPVAALLSHKVDVAKKRVGIILSGGNVDLEQLPW